jgi:hypothetical protein
MCAADWAHFFKAYAYAQIKPRATKNLTLLGNTNFTSAAFHYRIMSGQLTEIMEILAVFGNQFVVPEDLIHSLPVLYALLVSESHAYHHPRDAKIFCCNFPLFVCYIRHLLHEDACLEFSLARAIKQSERMSIVGGHLEPNEHSPIGINDWYEHFTPRYAFHVDLLSECEGVLPKGKHYSLYELVYILVYGVMINSDNPGSSTDIFGHRPAGQRRYIEPAKIDPSFFKELHKKAHNKMEVPREGNEDDQKQFRQDMLSDRWRRGAFVAEGKTKTKWKYDHRANIDDVRYLNGLGPDVMLARFLYHYPDSVPESKYGKYVMAQYKPVDENGEKSDTESEHFITQLYDSNIAEWYHEPKSSPKKTKTRKAVRKEPGAEEEQQAVGEQDLLEENGFREQPVTMKRKDAINLKPVAGTCKAKRLPPNAEIDSDLEEEHTKACLDDTIEGLKKVTSYYLAARAWNESGHVLSKFTWEHEDRIRDAKVTPEEQDESFTKMKHTMSVISLPLFGRKFDFKTGKFSATAGIVGDVGEDEAEEEYEKNEE